MSKFVKLYLSTTLRPGAPPFRRYKMQDNCALLAELIEKMTEEQFAAFLAEIKAHYASLLQE